MELDLKPFFSAAAFLSGCKSNSGQKPKPSGQVHDWKEWIKMAEPINTVGAQLAYRIFLETLEDNLLEDKA